MAKSKEKRVLILCGDDFEDLELWYPKLRFLEAGVHVTVAGPEAKKKYIGKKLMAGKRRLPPLKGQKRKRVKIVESDWEKYFGSSELVCKLVAERQSDFTREVLFLCKSKGELNYVEAREQFAREVLLSDRFYNNLIAVKIHGGHVASLRKI